MNLEVNEQFCLYLEKLLALVEKLERHNSDGGILLGARLTDDTLPLGVQIKIASNFALRACCNIAGMRMPKFNDDMESFSEARQYVLRVTEHIKNLGQSELIENSQNISDDAGLKKIDMPASRYLTDFALPNFFFHMSMVYATAKCNGVTVTKGDFDGIHYYPEGFSWETPKP